MIFFYSSLFPLFLRLCLKLSFSVRKWLWKWVSSQRSRRKKRRLSEGERDKFVRKELQSDRVSITRKIIGHVLVVCFKWHHRRKSEWREGKKRSARRRSWLRYWKRMRIRDSKNKSSSGSRTWRRQEQTSHSINASSLFLVLFRTSVSCHFYIFLLFNEQVKKSIRNLRRVWSITFTSSLS